MASERKGGLGAGASGLLRPTTRPEPDGSDISDGAIDGPDGQEGRGAADTDPKPTKPRRKRPPVSGETKGRKLHLPDDVADRLWQHARQRRQTVSAVATEILDRNLPRYRVEREA